MPKVKSECISILDRKSSERERLYLNYNINVNSKGLFYTNLNPIDIIKMEARGIIFDTNKRGVNGYFYGNSIQELNEKIETHCTPYFNVVELSREIVIKYSISTSCVYLVDDDNEVVPNGLFIKNYRERDQTNMWKTGTNGSMSTAQSCLTKTTEIY